MQQKQTKKYSPVKQQKSQTQLQVPNKPWKKSQNGQQSEFSHSFTKGTRKPKQHQTKSIAIGQANLPSQGIQKPSIPTSNHRQALSLTMKVNNCYSRSTAASISGSYCMSNSSNVSGSGKIIRDESDKQEDQVQTEIPTMQQRNSTNTDQKPSPQIIKPVQCYLEGSQPEPTQSVENKTLSKTQSHHRIKVINQNPQVQQLMTKSYNIPQSPLNQNQTRNKLPNNQEVQVIHPLKLQNRRQSTLSSFKESFNESENFLNMEERLDIENYSVRTQQHVKQKSLKQLIKEKFLGPQMKDNGLNSDSLLKRNILVTSSNISSGVESNLDSVASSFKSSFIIMQAKQGIVSSSNTRLSYQKNRQDRHINCSPINVEPEYINLDDTDEGLGDNDEKGLDKIQDYQFQPKSLFTDESPDSPQSKNQSQQLQNSSQKKEHGQINDYITSVKQGQQLIRPVQLRTSQEEQEQQEEAQEQNQEEIVEFLQSDTHKMHLIQTLQSLQYIKNHLQQPHMEELKRKRVTLPRFKKSWMTKTLIFDLDETLVHCVEDYEGKDVDTMITVNFPNGDRATAGLNFRPYLQECLKKAAEMFQVVVFTASHKAYADVVLDMLDPKREIFELRLYRDSCIRTPDGVYIKDLRIFQQSRKIEDIIIVDNAVYSFGYQLENGIPIIPFYNDKEDVELLHLIQYLECLMKNGGDVRQNNQRAFQLRELSELDVQSFFSNIIGECNQEQQVENQPEDTLNQSWDEEQQLRQLKQSQYEVKADIINEESNEEDESQSLIVQNSQKKKEDSSKERRVKDKKRQY